MIHDLYSYCHSGLIQRDELLHKLQPLEDNFEKVPDIAKDKITPLLHDGIRELGLRTNNENLKLRYTRLCDSLVELLNIEVMSANLGKKEEEERIRLEQEELERRRKDEERKAQEAARLKAAEEAERKRKEEERLRREREEAAKKPSSSIKNSIGMEFVLIPAGEFQMGSNESDDEQPVHKVKISKPFYLGKYPVTQKEWQDVMGNNPSYFKGDNNPVENVSWNDVQEFVEKLNAKEGTDKYRLPSEAEWEYACRAGTTTRYSFGDSESKLVEYAWYSGYDTYDELIKNKDKIVNEGSTHPVGLKKHNPWGLYDMHGNVVEWCQDRWHDSYEGAPTDGSAWEDGSSSYRVFRGGGWYYFARRCRSALRIGDDLDHRINGTLGFRLLMEV